MEWLEAARHPLAFSAYALSLAYAFALGRSKDKPAWFIPTFLALLLVAAVGGIVLYALNGVKPVDSEGKLQENVSVIGFVFSGAVTGKVDKGGSVHVVGGNVGGDALGVLVVGFLFLVVLSLVAGAVALLYLLRSIAAKEPATERGSGG